MEAKIKVDAGICGFKTFITATSEDNMHVELKVVSPCETIKDLSRLIKEKTPINAYQELSPQNESVVMGVSRRLLMTKGCCEACVVPAAVCKAVHIAAGLALPKDVTLEIPHR